MEGSPGKNLERVSEKNPIFKALVSELDAELAARDGEEHAFYAQFNSLETIRNAVLLYISGVAVGCGAFKKTVGQAVEIKRMYVKPEFRNRGCGNLILKELEQWAKERGAKKCVLETGLRQPEAIRLYERSGYARIENFGPYKGVENSVCFEKILS